MSDSMSSLAGRVGLNAEHTPVDAMTIVSLVLNALELVRGRVADKSSRQALIASPTPTLTAIRPPQLLRWKLPPSARSALERASSEVRP